GIHICAYSVKHSEGQDDVTSSYGDTPNRTGGISQSIILAISAPLPREPKPPQNLLTTLRKRASPPPTPLCPPRTPSSTSRRPSPSPPRPPSRWPAPPTSACCPP
uniref:Uncharacterized protein n=1 Tax=Aegilops tauschii subsp. strangulata TaxID=200361 RepID=A0A453BI14_AEGTS